MIPTGRPKSTVFGRFRTTFFISFACFLARLSKDYVYFWPQKQTIQVSLEKCIFFVSARRRKVDLCWVLSAGSPSSGHVARPSGCSGTDPRRLHPGLRWAPTASLFKGNSRPPPIYIFFNAGVRWFVWGTPRLPNILFIFQVFPDGVVPWPKKKRPFTVFTTDTSIGVNLRRHGLHGHRSMHINYEYLFKFPILPVIRNQTHDINIRFKIRDPKF